MAKSSGIAIAPEIARVNQVRFTLIQRITAEIQSANGTTASAG